jgi:16S rRNA processing protein RimM
VKKNKYEQFSSQQVDPLLAAIEKAERDQLALLLSHQSNNPVRGTTVPTIQASNNITKSKDASQLLLFRNSSSVVPSDPLTFGYIEIGMILGPHGVKGELKIQLESDFSELRASPGSILYVRKPNRRTPRAVQIISSRKQTDNTYLVFLNQINSRLAALAFKRYVVYVKEEDRPALQDDEYLIRDVVGMQCYLYSDFQRVVANPHSDYDLSTISPIGVVVGIIPPDELCDTTFARLMHAQLELELFVQSNHHHQQQQQVTNNESKKLLCMVPFVPSIVPVVNVANQCLFIDPPLGLLEMTYNDKPKRVVIRGYLPEFIDRLTDEAREYLRTRITYS